jgi:beta-glucosidase
MPPAPLPASHHPPPPLHHTFGAGNPCQFAYSASDCCARCTADPTCNAFTYVDGGSCATAPTDKMNGNGACWLKPDNSGLTNHTGLLSGTCAPQPAPPSVVPLVYNDGTNATLAAQIAAQNQIAIVVVATTSSEGSDRPDLSLPSYQDALVAAVAAANPNTIVVARCPGACLMPWKAAVPSILFQLMPGQEAGNALANALFGAVNPSGKLPVSFPGSMNDTWLGNPVNPLQYPGTDRGKGWLEADYTENLLIGYRWYDQQNIEPLWPFGHGLSYTTFSYSNLVVTGSVSPTGGATVTATVTNSGSVAGAEVAQLYVGYPAAAGEPPKLLKGFNKVALAPGASAQVSFTLSASALSIWNVVSDSWQLVPGTYQVLVGSTSRDIRLTGTVTVTSA